jgi:hypothetical protein
MLELRGATDGLLLDEPWRLEARGAGGAALTWRARLRDDDGRVWRAEAQRPEELAGAWAPAKRPAPGPVAALRSLRPVRVDVRAEAADGQAAARTVTRRLVVDGARRRRWRDAGLAATLHLPPGEPASVALLDGGDPAIAPLAAALLASRGVLVLHVTEGLDLARERLAAVPAAADAAPRVLSGGEAPLPPGVPATGEADAAAWDALLAALRATPRSTAS